MTGRHPLDVAVSLNHHRDNLDLQVIAGLDGRTPAPRAGTGAGERPDRRARLMAWVQDDRSPTENLHTLRGLVWHLGGAWARRDDPDVIVVHHAQLRRDLEGEMRRLADRLEIAVPAWRWPELVAAAGFAAMRRRAADLVPDERLGLISQSGAFFRSGASRQWDDVLTQGDVAVYEKRLAALASPELRRWLQGGESGE